MEKKISHSWNTGSWHKDRIGQTFLFCNIRQGLERRVSRYCLSPQCWNILLVFIRPFNIAWWLCKTTTNKKRKKKGFWLNNANLEVIWLVSKDFKIAFVAWNSNHKYNKYDNVLSMYRVYFWNNVKAAKKDSRILSTNALFTSKSAFSRILCGYRACAETRFAQNEAFALAVPTAALSQRCNVWDSSWWI